MLVRCRLDPKDSLMNAHINGIKCQETSTTTFESICSCRGGKPIACKGPQVDMQDATTMTYTDKSRDCLTTKSKQRRRRDVGRNEAINDEDDQMYEMMMTADEFPMPEVDENHGKNYTLKWPTPSGIDETEAKRRCQSKLKSSTVFHACESEVLAKHIDGIISDCVTDLQVTFLLLLVVIIKEPYIDL